MVINANDRQRTLSKTTKLGYISYQVESNDYLILSMLSEEENYQSSHRKSSMHKREHSEEWFLLYVTRRKEQGPIYGPYLRRRMS